MRLAFIEKAGGQLDKGEEEIIPEVIKRMLCRINRAERIST
tara:strand:+ start:381 stop:503 length:123 start_codon:yes stop_codon:yes gene_type:complete